VKSWACTAKRIIPVRLALVLVSEPPKLHPWLSSFPELVSILRQILFCLTKCRDFPRHDDLKSIFKTKTAERD
jgi:hypothetical protein